MNIISRGTKYCEDCGCRLYDYVEFEGYDGELDADISHEYCDYVGDLCSECAEKEEEEEEENEA